MRAKRPLTRRDFELMGIPPRYNSSTWDSIPEVSKKTLEEPLRSMHLFVESGGCFFIYGPPLSGKSSLASYLCRLFRSYSYTSQWASASDVQDSMTQKTHWDDTLTHRERFLSVDVLVVDDLGSELHSAKYRNFVVEVLKKRYEWKKTVIVTTSLPFSEMLTSYGDAFTTWVKKTFKGVPTSS